MRTLKKVLALSLVFAMAFTLMAGAAFKDQDKIDSDLTDDIQLMTALGVFQGDETGSFNPEANVTRAQAAKMIYVLKNNGVDDGAVAFQGVSKYADVTTGFWGEGYINYSTNLGYMNGWKEGNVQKFDPNGNVTGIELAKMLLCMIGYKSDIQGYTGNNWQQNVQQDAAEAGIFREFEPSVYVATPRQWTARMLTNAINATYVTYTKGELVYGTNGYGAEVSYASKYLKLETLVGVLDRTPSNQLADSMSAALRGTKYDDMHIKNISEYSQSGLFASNATNLQATFKDYTPDVSLLGQEVKVYYKASSTATDTNSNKVYAVLPYDKNETVINTTLAGISYDDDYAKGTNYKVKIGDLGSINYNGKVKADEATTWHANPIELYVNNVKATPESLGLLDAAKEVQTVINMDTLKGNLFGVNSTQQVKLIVNSDNYVVRAYVNEPVAYAKVDKNDSAKNTFTVKQGATFLKETTAVADGADTVKNADIFVGKDGSALTFDNNSNNKDNYSNYLNFVDTVEKDDIIAITQVVDDGVVKYNIAKAATVDGKPSSYTVKTSEGVTYYNKLTINGDSYSKAKLLVDSANYTWAQSTSVASDTTFYTDGKYVVYSEGGKEEASVDSLAYIIGVIEGSSYDGKAYKVKALLNDGTVGEYEVANTYHWDGGWVKDSNLVEPNAHQVYTYTLSNGKISLKAMSEATNDTIVSNGDLTFMKDKYLGFDDDNNTVKTYNAKAEGTSANKTYRTNSSTYFFVVTGIKDGNNYKDAKYSVIKASEMNGDMKFTDAVKTTQYAAKTSSGFPTLAYAVLETGKKGAVASTTPYAFVNGNVSASVDGDTWYVNIPVLVKGQAYGDESQTLVIKADDESSAKSQANDIQKLKGNVITYTQVGDYVEDVAKIVASKTMNEEEWTAVKIRAWADDQALIQTIAGAQEFVNVADDANIYVVDVTKSPVEMTNDDVEKAKSDIIDADGELTAVIRYTENNGAKTITDIYVASNGNSALKSGAGIFFKLAD